MISEKLKILVNNPEVIYLYDMGQFSLRKHRYIAITQPNSGHKISIEADEDIDLLCIPINKWFKKVTNGELIAWQCNCLPRKYILKEAVKLMLSTDPITLYQKYLKIKHTCDQIIKENDIQHLDKFWRGLFDIKCISEILESHKIVNYTPPIDFESMLMMIQTDGLEVAYYTIIHKYEEHIQTICVPQYKNYIKHKIIDKNVSDHN